LAKPDKSFFIRPEVTHIASELLGKLLISDIGGRRTSGIIVETEAYSWREKGCHAFQNKMTKRNSTMFLEGGVAYVYLCYGIHSLLNVVTNTKGQADAVLIRALEPVDGIAIMQQRTGAKTERRITSGPGKLTKALGVDISYDGLNLLKSKSIIRIEDANRAIAKQTIVKTTRIGIEFAGDDSKLPWRFYLRDNPWVSVIC
jgi:DNA-3-methyladenine glycosylase